MSISVDVLVIGGGISGVSLAAQLAPRVRVAVAEAEAHLGTQTTARSAALFGETHGPAVIRQLISMSRAFFESPPEGFADGPLCRPRGIVVCGRETELAALRASFESGRQSAPVEWLDAAGLLELCPLLKPGAAAAGFVEPGGMDLEPHALLQAFARVMRRNGGTIVTSAPMQGIARQDGKWQVKAGDHAIACDAVAIAAGAWSDEVAALAGTQRIGLTPMRRTAATIAVPAELAAPTAAHPATMPLDESFYYRPMAPGLMVSLSEETPSVPCDAYAEDIDVALALERFHDATIVPRVRPTATWAGLRTFAPDRLPVVGFAPDAEGVFWYAGQGGTGIEMSPALSAIAAKVLLGEDLEGAEAALAQAVSAARFSDEG